MRVKRTNDTVLNTLVTLENTMRVDHKAIVAIAAKNARILSG